MKKIAVILISLLILFNMICLASAKKETEIQQVSDEIIVKFKENIDNKKYNTTIKDNITSDIKVLKIKDGKSVDDTLKIYKNLKGVEYAEPNYLVQALMIPNDTYYEQQWNFKMIDIERAWDISNGSGVIVAVIDTGVTKTTDLLNTNFINGYDFVNSDNYPTDDNGHGTHVTGTIAQTTNNGYGVSGIAYGCTIMPIKVLDSQGGGTYANVAQGIYYAVNNGAKVISLSLGGTSPSITLKDAIDYAYSHDVVVVVAGGNSYQSGNPIIYPAYYPTVIAVGGVRLDGIKAYYSSTGDYIDITAPGGDLNLDQDNNGYLDGIMQQINDNSFVYKMGTSMACPHVTGAVALLLSNNITGVDEIKYRLEVTATDKGDSGYDTSYGWGILNISKALLYNYVPTITPSPTPQTSPTPTPYYKPKATPTPMPPYNYSDTTPAPETSTLSENNSLYEYMLPILIVLLPTIILYIVFRNQLGMILGALIGVILGINANIISAWTLVIIITGVVMLLFIKPKEDEV